MDANSTFTFGLLFMFIGGFSAVYGIIAKRDSKKLQEGKAQGILEATLKQMNETLDAFKKSNDIFVSLLIRSMKDYCRHEKDKLQKSSSLLELS